MNTTNHDGQRRAGIARRRRVALGRLSAKALLAPVLVAAATLGGVAATSQADAAQRASVDAGQAAKAREEAGRKARELVARQQFIAEVTESAFNGETFAEPAEQPIRFSDAATIAGLAAEVPSLAALEAAQDEQIADLTARAETRAAAAERTIRRAGLNPRLVMTRIEDRNAQGGPLLSLAESEALVPSLAKLGSAAARMSGLEQGLATIPTHVPANLRHVSVSSGFGYRSDPFTGDGAMHAGLDFRGPIGAPIQAAADGTVTFAGVKGGYGNCIEVTHGNGMMTRYAHLSGFKARVGQKVAAGDTIATLGNTGRSTGPHLHFEVRIDGAAVNPRRFLEAAH